MHLPARTIAAALLMTTAALAFAAFDVRMVGIVFDSGSDSAEVTDAITGDEAVMYRFRPKMGQRIEVSLESDSDDAEFTVYAPGKWPGEVLHDSATDGSREFEGRIDRDGFHAVTVYQNQEAVSAGRTARYELEISLTD